MGLSTLLAQAATPTSGWDMLFGGTWATRMVLLVLASASLFSWVLLSSFPVSSKPKIISQYIIYLRFLIPFRY